MKYFTRSWANGEPSDEECEQVRCAYWAHVDGLIGRLPGAVAELATVVNLHDALIRRVTVDVAAQGLRVELRCGDLQRGYFDADLRYWGVPLEETDLVTLEDRARDPGTEVLYDEVDVSEDGQLSHRFLFWPDGELEIRFTAFAMDRLRKNDRIRPRTEDVYSKGPVDHD